MFETESKEDLRRGEGDVSTLTSSTTRWQASRESVEAPTVLEPEHPLMKKFQEALRQYLIKENDRVYTELLELKTNLKQNKRNYATQMAQEMYSLEQEVQAQRTAIQQYEDTLKNMMKLREEREKELKMNKKLHKKQTEKFNTKKREDMELLGELDALNLLCKQYESWQNETDCDLAVNQRISDKMAEEKQQLTVQQKELDVMMFKLTTEVWSLEGKLKLLEEQSQIKGEEREALAEKAADHGAALAALHTEHTRLLQAWGSVITHVQQRDHFYNQLSQEYRDLQSDYRILNSNIEGIKKEIADAMSQHENLTVQKDKTMYDLANCLRSIKIEDRKRDNIEKSMQEVYGALEFTEKELQQAKLENIGLNNNMKIILREIERLTEAKLKLEWDTLEQLQERMVCDKATQSMAAAIRKNKEESRRLEVILLSGENQQARISLLIEQLKEKNGRTAELGLEAEKAVKAKQDEVEAVEAALGHTLMDISRKQTSLENATKKLNTLLEHVQGVEKSPSLRKVEELEKNISDTSQQIETLQQDWLRAQGRVVALSEQRQEQVANMNITRKQIQVLESKNIKLEKEIERLSNEDVSIKRSVDALQASVDVMYQQKTEDQRHNAELEAAYNNLTLEYMAQLKDIEVETMQIEEQLVELEEDKEQLAIDLHAIRKEAMSWQKMVILAVETKQKIIAEKGAGSETEKMKAEIHRMQVRQAQLSRLATRLADELAHGVTRRETAAGRAVHDPRRRRLALPHALRDKKCQIRAVQQEIDMNKSMLETLSKEESFLQNELNEKTMEISDTEKYISNIRMELDEAHLTKQKNLERLVSWQRCAQRWGAVGAGRAPVGLSGAAAATAELDRQTHTRRALRALATGLLKTRPDHARILKILATLGVGEKEGRKDDEASLPTRDCSSRDTVEQEALELTSESEISSSSTLQDASYRRLPE